jgi:oligopeptide/dipeptide ABC transporter ATP-binding protein
MQQTIDSNGSDILLSVRNLTKHFPVRTGIFQRITAWVQAVDDVSFYVKKGETLGLVGESGCGKTTLGRTVLRLLDPTSGQVFFEGQDVASIRGDGLKRARKDMQIIFQDPFSSLNPRMTVMDIVSEPLRIHGEVSGDELKGRVRELLECVGMRVQHMNRYPYAFSGGQRQRVGIARALALKPKFIVCDEPVSALDVSIQAQVVNLLSDLQKTMGLTYLFISHDLSVVEHISDRVAVMYLGSIVELAASEELYATPRHPYTEALLSAVPSADPDRTIKRIVLPGDVPSPSNPPPGCKFHPRCPYAVDLCKTAAPQWREVSPMHWVACHRADELKLAGIAGE